MIRSASGVPAVVREDDVLLEERNGEGRGRNDILDDVAIFQRYNATACVHSRFQILTNIQYDGARLTMQ
jgi:hypothetical protein